LYATYNFVLTEMQKEEIWDYV